MSTKQPYILNIHIDASKCTACKACELACSFLKEGVFSPSYSRIRIMQLHELGINVPLLCVNCANAPCIPACPTNAIFRDDDVPVVRVNEAECIGCGECIQACPFGAIEMNLQREIAMICDLCDGNPACVDHCMYGALGYSQTLSTTKLKRLTHARGIASHYLDSRK